MLVGHRPWLHIWPEHASDGSPTARVGKNRKTTLTVYQMAASQPITLYKHWNVSRRLVSRGAVAVYENRQGASTSVERRRSSGPKAGIKIPDIQYHS